LAIRQSSGAEPSAGGLAVNPSKQRRFSTFITLRKREQLPNAIDYAKRS
jgi:hypothetical protein